MKITVEYDLPDEAYDCKQAFFASEAWQAIHEADEALRSQLKHGNPKEDGDAIAEARKILGEALGRLE